MIALLILKIRVQKDNVGKQTLMRDIRNVGHVRLRLIAEAYVTRGRDIWS